MSEPIPVSNWLFLFENVKMSLTLPLKDFSFLSYMSLFCYPWLILLGPMDTQGTNKKNALTPAPLCRLSPQFTCSDLSLLSQPLHRGFRSLSFPVLEFI